MRRLGCACLLAFSAMSLYADTSLPIPEEFEALHADELLSFARPGTWGTAAQRITIAAEIRKTRVEAGVQESVGDENLCDTAEVPEAARRVARAAALGGIEIDRAFCAKAQADGLTDGAYVEGSRLNRCQRVGDRAALVRCAASVDDLYHAAGCIARQLHLESLDFGYGGLRHVEAAGYGYR